MNTSTCRSDFKDFVTQHVYTYDVYVSVYSASRSRTTACMKLTDLTFKIGS